MSEIDRMLERFHKVLVEEIETKRPAYMYGPFTVAEIYQNLVPYGTHRDRLGLEMNGDYEDALLRLLAGEGDYLVLESTHALRELKEELESPNPNTGVYREFAAVDVRLNPVRLSAGGAARAVPASFEAVGLDGPPPHAEEPGLFPEPGEPAVLSVSDLAPNEASEADSVQDSCRWCRAELPRRANLKYCPFCGTDVRVVPCPGCGEELEPEWRFCVACGTEVEG